MILHETNRFSEKLNSSNTGLFMLKPTSTQLAISEKINNNLEKIELTGKGGSETKYW